MPRVWAFLGVSGTGSSRRALGFCCFHVAGELLQELLQQPFPRVLFIPQFTSLPVSPLLLLLCADVVAFMLMQAIIGSYRKHEEGLVPGKLSANTTVRNIATKMQTGCAEMFSAFNTCYRDTGLFGFYAQCDEVAVEHCVLDLMHGITALSYSVSTSFPYFHNNHEK